MAYSTWSKLPAGNLTALGSQRLESITVWVRNNVSTKAAEAQLRTELQHRHGTARHGKNDVFIYNSDQIRKGVMKSSHTMAAFRSFFVGQAAAWSKLECRRLLSVF